jgi:hypothetical protein
MVRGGAECNPEVDFLTWSGSANSDLVGSCKDERTLLSGCPEGI